MYSSNDTYINPINPTYGELFEQELNGYILAVPPYQRPYVWTKKKVETLMNDWLEYLQSRQFINGIDYYMGTIIIHKDNDNKKWAHFKKGAYFESSLTSVVMLSET